MSLSKQIIDTWQIHNRIMLLMLDHIPEEHYDLTQNPRGGGKIGHQLAHIYNVRYWRIEAIDKSRLQGFDILRKDDEKKKEDLQELYQFSSDILTDLIAEAIERGGEIKRFKRGVVPMIGHLISHEAHHRGNILHTMKIAKVKLPNELKYGIWEWNKV